MDLVNTEIAGLFVVLLWVAVYALPQSGCGWSVPCVHVCAWVCNPASGCHLHSPIAQALEYAQVFAC